MQDKQVVNLDLGFLTKVKIGCSPSIFNGDAETVSESQPAELETVKNDFIIKILGLADGPDLDAAIDAVMEKYGSSNRNKYRAVIYYLLTLQFKKENTYN